MRQMRVTGQDRDLHLVRSSFPVGVVEERACLVIEDDVVAGVARFGADVEELPLQAAEVERGEEAVPEVDGVRAMREVLDPVDIAGSERAVEDEGIAVASALEDVVAVAAVDLVVAAAALDRVAPSPAEKRVVAAIARQGIVAISPAKRLLRPSPTRLSLPLPAMTFSTFLTLSSSKPPILTTVSVGPLSVTLTELTFSE